MAASSDTIRQIYEGDIGQPADEKGIQYWQSTGLDGDALIKAMRYSAGMDSQAYDDPAYAAFARANRAKLLTINSDRDAQLNEIERQRQLAAANIASQTDRSLEAANNNFAARGMYSSGGLLDARRKVAEDAAAQGTQSELQYANQANSVTRGAAGSITDLAQQRAEQEAAARSRMTAQSISDANMKFNAQQAATAAKAAAAQRIASVQTARQPFDPNRPGTPYDPQTRYVAPTQQYKPTKKAY